MFIYGNKVPVETSLALLVLSQVKQMRTIHVSSER